MIQVPFQLGKNVDSNNLEKTHGLHGSRFHGSLSVTRRSVSQFVCLFNSLSVCLFNSMSVCLSVHSQLIQAMFQVSMGTPVLDSSDLEKALESGFSRCVEKLCQFGADGDLLFGVLKNETAFEGRRRLSVHHSKRTLKHNKGK